ncbi:hypothetical protein GH714_008290 [Hevea brasiliensis]|uniref:Uncharacterized protein n=1 Tax=Hevea brasiliensis TaxID=3981 RepID=A0A6A6KM87_HEVBR|nr:hypothetical protein GH714_008290 [Hevea brasiliensis]
MRAEAKRKVRISYRLCRLYAIGARRTDGTESNSKPKFHFKPLRTIFIGEFQAKCEEIVLVRKVFDEITERNLVFWSAMINGHAGTAMVNKTLGALD